MVGGVAYLAVYLLLDWPAPAHLPVAFAIAFGAPILTSEQRRREHERERNRRQRG